MALPTEEQEMLRDMAHNWAQKECPVRAFRDMRDGGDPRGFDAATFSTIAEMGWAGTVVPEEFGGVEPGFTGRFGIPHQSADVPAHGQVLIYDVATEISGGPGNENSGGLHLFFLSKCVEFYAALVPRIRTSASQR